MFIGLTEMAVEGVGKRNCYWDTQKSNMTDNLGVRGTPLDVCIRVLQVAGNLRAQGGPRA